MNTATVIKMREDDIPDEIDYSRGNPFIYAPPGRTVLRSELEPGSMQYLSLVDSGQLDPQRELAALQREPGRKGRASETPSYNPTVVPLQELAAQFAQNCKSFAWGGEDPEELKAFLTGLLDAFQPRNGWELELLANVADVQWKIRRTRKIQKGIYENGSDTRDVRGVKAKTTSASKLDQDIERLQIVLDKAITTYSKVRNQ